MKRQNMKEYEARSRTNVRTRTTRSQSELNNPFNSRLLHTRVAMHL